jgi:hypothetical protein
MSEQKRTYTNRCDQLLRKNLIRLNDIFAINPVT